MTPEDLAVRAASLALWPGARIEGVRVDGARCFVEVSGGVNKVVERAGSGMAPWMAFAGDGFEVCTVHNDIVATPPPPGYFVVVCVFDDGAAARLDDAAAFRAFHRRVGRALDPVMIAHLLATTQANGRTERVIVKMDDLRWLRLERDVASIAGFTLPRTTGAGEFEFCSYDNYPEPPRDVDRVHLSGWRVTGLDGDITWEARPLARGLVSRFFDPK